MAKSGPIIFIEDDNDDIDIMTKILGELRVKNEFISFTDPTKALTYLREVKTQPFLIFCDINLPILNGLSLKREIDSDPILRQKSIPFIFYSTTADKSSINTAYTEMTVQGFFEKGVLYEEIKDDIHAIINYWKRCKHPAVANNL